MATFTITLKDVMSISGGYDIDNPAEYPWQYLGLDKYPIFDETHRVPLNVKIIDHFWNREIGQETVSMFKLALRRKMNEIMPLYNQHYSLSALTYDPLTNVDMKDTGSTTRTGTASSTSESDSKSRTVLSDTPQTALSGNEDYASGLNDVIGQTTGTGSSTTNDTDTLNTEHKGYTGSPAELVLRARQTLVNVDMMVIAELESLFMQVWDNGDEFSTNGWYL